ncbi:hypothetical protein BKA80DRAFT_32099 [Phyllosticta citrichinensis]
MWGFLRAGLQLLKDAIELVQLRRAGGQSRQCHSIYEGLVYTAVHVLFWIPSVDSGIFFENTSCIASPIWFSSFADSRTRVMLCSTSFVNSTRLTLFPPVASQHRRDIRTSAHPQSVFAHPRQKPNTQRHRAPSSATQALLSSRVPIPPPGYLAERV